MNLKQKSIIIEKASIEFNIQKRKIKGAWGVDDLHKELAYKIAIRYALSPDFFVPFIVSSRAVKS